jgi:hypothetical protein
MAIRLLFAALTAAFVAVPSAASAPAFGAHAHLVPSGCNQAMVGSIVKITGCAANATMTGSVSGKLSLSYGAKVDIARGSGAQSGQLTLTSANGKDTLVARFSGVVTIGTGASVGRWTATKRTGVFAHVAGRGGTYVSRTPDQGAHVTFDVRG